MPGPLPSPTRRRANPPTIPTRFLPASGRRGRPPRLPRWVELGESGSAWWRWAWRLPQAAGWSAGTLVTVARRAQLEDIWSAEPNLTTAREIRELDDRLGLTPRGLLALRWEIVDDQDTNPGPVEAGLPVDDEVARRRTEREQALKAEGG